MMTGRKQHDDDSGFSLTLAPVCHECADNGTDIRMYFVDARISPTQFKVCLRGGATIGTGQAVTYL